MKKKVLRQAINVSIEELRDLADKLLQEGKELEQELGIKDTKLLTKTWSIAIVNKSPMASDTWEIEK